MKKIFFGIGIMLIGFTSVLAQKPENFIELKNGTVVPITAEMVKEKEPLFKPTYLKVGGDEYLIKNVKGYQYQGKYFSNLNDLKFMPATTKGKIQMYQYSDVYTFSNGKTKTVFHRFLQSGEDGKWVKFSVSALKGMVRGNKEALKMVNKYQLQRSKGKKLMLFGSIGVLTCMAAVIVGQVSTNPGTKTGLTIAGATVGAAGLGVMYVGVYHGFKGEAILFRAIDIYNKGNQ